MDELKSLSLPHSAEAEQAVLGSILIDARCMAKLVKQLIPDDFYLRQNRELYEVLCTMFSQSQTIDPVTVAGKMKQTGIFDEETTVSYLRNLVEITPTAANAAEYANIVKEKALLRQASKEEAQR